MVGGLFLVVSVVLLFVSAQAASADTTGSFSEEAIHFKSGGVTLRGTVLVPDDVSPEEPRRPAIVLVHGAGPGSREETRAEAEAFARRGLVVLIYDKRTEGYSQTERSYELLADDALAAVRTLRVRPDVDRGAVGLWGLSEGGWVVPIAATRSSGPEEVDFIVLVAATGVPPAQQHSWSQENELRRQGVSGSMIESVSRKGTRLLIEAGLFAEAYHDPVTPLEQVQQPVLALYGAKDRIEPPVESARILRNALERGGNDQYEIRFFPNAEHGLRSSPNGFVVRERFVTGYPERVASWVTRSPGARRRGRASSGKFQNRSVSLIRSPRRLGGSQDGCS